MQHLHDDNHLDGLSREAAERFETDPSLHSWDKLQSKLDAALPQKKEKKRRPFFFILFFFLLAGGGITISALLWKNNQIAEGSPAPTSESVPANSNITPSANTRPVSTSPDQTGGNTQTETAGNNKPAPSNTVTSTTAPSNTAPSSTVPVPADETATRPALQNSTAPNQPATQAVSRQDRPVHTNKPLHTNAHTPVSQPSIVKNSQKNKQPETLPQPMPGKVETGLPVTAAKEPATINPVTTQSNHSTTSSVGSQNTEETATKEAAKKEEPAKEEAATAAPPKEEVINPQDKPSTPKKNKQDTPLKNRWEFGAVYAPDMSTVKFTHTRKPGSNIGLSIGYNFSRRWSLQTGILYTTKNYRSKGEDYHPPKGYWTDYVDLETVTATCDMWDIPLNLRYNLAPRKSSNVFASAGLSSYLMKKEDYEYDYYYNGNLVSRSRSYATDTRHWFSVLNLSVAYERQLSRHISVQAEPFFKQPLKGLGFGSVKLNTTGLFLSLKYKPLAGKPAHPPKSSP
jgi:hypothetical protein